MQYKKTLFLFLIRKSVLQNIFYNFELYEQKHLTNDQRYTISVMYQQGHKQKDVALVFWAV